MRPGIDAFSMGACRAYSCVLEFLIKGGALGFAAAIQPGPFQAYLLSQVSAKGWRRTLPAAAAPLISDAPIVVLMLFVVRQMPEGSLSLIRAAGGVFLLYLAWRALAPAQGDPDTAGDSSANALHSHGILHAAIMNLLNPNPYIFWGTVGAVAFLDGWNLGAEVGAAFMVGMYTMLVGGLALVVLAFGTVGAFGPRVSRALSVVSGLALAGFGVVQLLGAIPG